MSRLYDEVYQQPDDYPAATKDPSYFVEQVRANADNDRLSDSEFRQFVLNILPIYEKK